MASCVCKPPPLYLRLPDVSCPLRFSQPHHLPRLPLTFIDNLCSARGTSRLRSSSDPNNQTETVGIQLYRDIDRILADTVKQSQGGWGASGDWSEIEGAWVLRPKTSKVEDIPTFGIGHSLGSVVHLLIGSRYAVQRNGNILMAFNNKEAGLAIPLLSPVLVPMAQSIGPFLSQIASSPTIRLGAEMTRKQFENLSPTILKQVLPLVEQLPPLYMNLAKGRENFSPKPEETRRLIRS